MYCRNEVEARLKGQVQGDEWSFVDYLCSIAVPAQEIVSELQHWRDFQNALSLLSAPTPSLEEIRTMRSLLRQGKSVDQVIRFIQDERKSQQEKATMLNKIQNMRPSSPKPDDSFEP